MVEEQIHSVLMYTGQSTGGFVLILNFQKRESGRARKWSAVGLIPDPCGFQKGAKNKLRSCVDNYHSEGQTQPCVLDIDKLTH